MAAARPLGPAPTTIASSDVELAGLGPGRGRAPTRSPRASRRRTGAHPCRVSLRTGAVSVRRAERRVALLRTFRAVAPLAVLVDADDLRLDDGLGDADVPRQVRAGSPRQNRLFMLVAAEHVGDLVERVRRPLECLRLGDRDVAVAIGGEGDPCRQGMAFGGHERERLVVRVEDHDAGRQRHRGARHRVDLQQGDLARARSRPAGRRTARPSARTSGSASFQVAIDRLRASSRRRRAGRVNVFCHSWPKPWSGPDDALAADGVVLGAGHAGGRQAVDRLGPVRGIAIDGSRGVGRGGGRSGRPSVVSVFGRPVVRRSRPRRPPPRRRGSRSPRRGGSATRIWR